MTTPDEFGSLFDSIPPVQASAGWGEDTSYDFETDYLFAGPNTPHPGLGHTMDSSFVEYVPETVDGNPESALPVTYGTDEDLDDDELVQRIHSALQLAPRGRLTPESDEDRGRRLLAYVDASLSGQSVEGPNPFSHIQAGESDNELASAAQNFLAAKTSLKTYNERERQAIIEEGAGVRASNLDRLEISGTHYEALEQARPTTAPDDEDLTFLDGDPNL